MSVTKWFATDRDGNVDDIHPNDIVLAVFGNGAPVYGYVRGFNTNVKTRTPNVNIGNAVSADGFIVNSRPSRTANVPTNKVTILYRMSPSEYLVGAVTDKWTMSTTDDGNRPADVS